MTQTIKNKSRVPIEAAGSRLDQHLAELFPEFSRSRLQVWTREGAIVVDGQEVKPSLKLKGGELISVDVALEEESDIEPQAIALDIVFEDDEIIVVDKPAGLVVHPAAGNPDGTLQNALLHHDAALAAVPRAGIVHRLDKLTSGVMVVARTLQAHASLVEQLQERAMHREYRTLVYGALVAGGTIDAPIGRHPADRLKMAVVGRGKPAISHYRIERRYTDFTWLKVKLETGRTHQIRVHMAHIHHPVVGDPVYGGRLKLPAGASEALKNALHALDRQALHAFRLSFEHPTRGEAVTFEAPLPADLARLVDCLDGDERQGGR